MCMIDRWTDISYEVRVNKGVGHEGVSCGFNNVPTQAQQNGLANQQRASASILFGEHL